MTSEMQKVIVAWSNGSAEQFENSVPLRFVGERNLRLGFENSFTVLFLDGIDRLSAAYKDHLNHLGYTLIDAQLVFEELKRKYSNLARFGDYETKCFLRWPVIQSFLGAQNFAHFDGDIVFNSDPDKILLESLDSTIVVQGCPALTIVRSATWVEAYLEALNSFCRDIQGYSANAWSLRVGWEQSQRHRWAGARHRQIISSDQDLISHLIHIGELPQTDPGVFCKRLEDHIFFEQPLSLDLYNRGPFKYSRVHGIDYLNDKRIAFWHMQSDFCYFLLRFISRDRYLCFLPTVNLRRENIGVDHFLTRLVLKFQYGGRLPRSILYRYFFEEHDFSRIFSSRHWWKEGVFT